MQSTSQSTLEPGATAALPRRTALLWLLSVALGSAAAAMLYQAAPGLSWPLIVTGTMLALLFIERPGKRGICTRRYAALGLACVLSGAAAVTAESGVQVLLFMTILWLGALAACLGGGLRPDSLGVGRLAGAPFVAPALVVREATRVVGEGVGALGTEESVPPLRGVALAVPIVAILIALLGEADPVFGAFRDAARALLTNLTGLGRVIFGFAFGLACLGYLNLARRQRTQPVRWRDLGDSTRRHTDVERLIVLGSIAALFAVFLLLQVSYLFGNPGARPGSGVTLAEAVHRGFTEMSFVVAFVAAVLALLERGALRGAREPWVGAISGVVVIECLVLLASAYHRLVAYEAAYGYTELRMGVRLYIGFLAITMLLLALELNAGLNAARFCWRVSVAAVATLAVIGYWNYGAWIVEANIERYARTGQLDTAYLAQTSVDGLPELVRLLPHLDAASRAAVLERIGPDPYAGRWWAHSGAASAWFEWNLRRSAARTALKELSHELP